MRKKAVVIVGYGSFKPFDDFWEKWLDESKSLFSLADQTPTHIGIKCETMNDGKIKTLSRSEKKVREAIHQGETISIMSLSALKKGFHTGLDHEFFVTIFRSNYRKR